MYGDNSKEFWNKVKPIALKLNNVINKKISQIEKDIVKEVKNTIKEINKIKI